MDDLAKQKHRQENKETFLSVLISNLFSLLKIFLVCIVLVFIIFNYLVRPIQIEGGSMFPTLKDHEIALSNAFAARFLTINRGDLVVAYDRKKIDSYIVKRVIGLPGETISCKDDTIYINGKILKEPYLNNDFSKNIRETNIAFTENFKPITLGDGEYWLMGDNRYSSWDSRHFGVFEKNSIKGIGIAVVLPVNKMRVVK